MDPLSLVLGIRRVVWEIYKASEGVRQNREECRRLVDHANEIFAVIQEGINAGAESPALTRILLRLQG